MTDQLRVVIRLGKIQSYLFQRLAAEQMKEASKQLRGRSLLALLLPRAFFKELVGTDQAPDLAAAGFVEALLPEALEERLRQLAPIWVARIWALGEGTLTLDVVWDRVTEREIETDAEDHATRWRLLQETAKLRRWCRTWPAIHSEPPQAPCSRCGRLSMRDEKDTPCWACQTEIDLGKQSVVGLDHLAFRWQDTHELMVSVSPSPTPGHLSIPRPDLQAATRWQLPRWGQEPKTFSELAWLCRGEGDERRASGPGPGGLDGEPRDGNPRGHLAMFKADVDNLGVAFHQSQSGGGLKARLEARKALSQRLNAFFGDDLARSLQQPLTDPVLGEVWRNPLAWIYPLFSGGDDLVLIGPAQLMVPVARQVRTAFKAAFPNLDLSAGLARFKPNWPIGHVHRQAEELEHAAKVAGKSRLAVSDLEVFDEKTVKDAKPPKWVPYSPEWEELNEAYFQPSALMAKAPAEVLPTKLLYRFLNYLGHHERYRHRQSSNLQWFWHLQYTLARHRSNLKPEQRLAFEQPEQLLTRPLTTAHGLRPDAGQAGLPDSTRWSLLLAIHARRGGE